VDVDGAQYVLGQNLGIFQSADNFPTDTKWVFWCNNTLGNMLYALLRKLSDEGVLLYRTEPDMQFKWNTEYDWHDAKAPIPEEPVESL